MTSSARFTNFYLSLSRAAPLLQDEASTLELMKGGVSLLNQVRSQEDLNRSQQIITSLWLRFEQSTDRGAFAALKQQQEEVILEKTQKLADLRATLLSPVAKNDSMRENLASS